METVDIDKLFGPMRAEEEALLLGGYEAVQPEVIEVMKGLSEEDRKLILEISPVDANNLQSRCIDMVVGYHLIDPERTMQRTRDKALDQLRKARQYLELKANLLRFPFLDAHPSEFGNDKELKWRLSDIPQMRIVRWRWASRDIRNLDNIVRAVEDPVVCEEILYEELRQARAELNMEAIQSASQTFESVD